MNRRAAVVSGPPTPQFWVIQSGSRVRDRRRSSLLGAAVAAASFFLALVGTPSAAQVGAPAAGAQRTGAGRAGSAGAGAGSARGGTAGTGTPGAGNTGIGAGGPAIPTGPTGPGPMAASVGPYRLAIGDSIAILVRNHEDLGTMQLIRPDGVIDYPALGLIPVAGKTTTQLRSDLIDRLSRFLVNPDVNITITGYHQDRVYVLGEVRGAGPIQFTDGMKLPEAIILSGNVTDTADVDHIAIQRDHRTFATLSLDSAQARALLLKPDDVIVIPKLPLQTFTMVGALARPGVQPLLPHEQLLDALTSEGVAGQAGGGAAAGAGAAGGAGGGSWQEADLAHVTLTRGADVRVLNAQNLLEGNLQDNIALEPGDILYVPAASHITIVGAVQRPGNQLLSPDERLLDAITAAGVLTTAGSAESGAQAALPDLSHSTLTRKGQTQVVDLAALFKGDLTGNIPMQAGDVLYVPEQQARTIMVVGDVARPGTQPLGPFERLLDALTAAGATSGGAAPSSATPAGAPAGGSAAATTTLDLAHVTLTRNGTVRTIDVLGILKGNLQDNIILAPEDVIYVPSEPGKTFTMIGAIPRPGTFPLAPGLRLLDAITATGVSLSGTASVGPAAATAAVAAGPAAGPMPAAAPAVGPAAAAAAPAASTVSTATGSSGGPALDLAHVTLTRGADVRTIDVTAILKGSLQDNVPLESGDVIYIPAQPDAVVTLLGEVARPEALHIGPDTRVLDAINSAGSTTPAADLKRATLRRLDNTTQTIDLYKLIHDNDTSQNVVLHNGDVLSVPTLLTQVAIFGAVGKPGVYPYKAGDGIFQLTVLAGGASQEADLKKITVIEYEDGRPKDKVTVDIDAAMKKGDFKKDRLLHPGDVVFVPSRHPGGAGLAGGLNSIMTAAELARMVLVPW